jgi:hypothetical protein
MLLALSTLACAPKFDGEVYNNGQLRFRVGPVPSDWRGIEVDQALLAYRSDRAGETIAVGGRCNKDGDDVPLTSLTHHLFLHFTEREVISQKTLDLDGRAALRTEMMASLDGVSKHYVVYVLKKDGCVYDFMRISDSTRSEADEFDSFVSGFETMS